MFPLPKGAVRICVVTFFVSLFFHEISSEGRIVCYYTNWSVYRPGTAKFNPQNINPYLCTHLIYAFGGFTKDNTLKPFDKYQDIEQGGYSKFTGLKTYNKNLKTLLAIGGWNEGSSRFSPLVASPERRHQFIKNILKFLRQNHFDGLDLDWEYPAFRDGGKPRDKENYAQFVQELRSEFDRESSKTGRSRLLLTMAVPAGVEYIDKGYDIPKLNKYLDWFNILSYDYHSAYEPSANHHSPLFSLEEESEYNFDGDLYIDYTVKFYLNAGADRDKLVLGIPTYGRTYTLVNEDSTDIGAPADGPGEQGDATREKGYLAYYEICQNLRDDPDWTVIQPNPNAMGPYAYRGNQWVGYDDESIVKKKAEFVVDNDLGGIMFWSIDNDDFRGACGGKPYPLIEAAKEAMLERLGVGDNEVTRSSRPRKPQRSRSRKGSSNRNNIINDSSTNKIRDSSKKQSARRTSNKKTVSRSTTSTTTPPSTSGSLYIGGRTTTPPPPTTPDPGADFKCVDEGFFPHPRDCKKYFWCLDSGPSDLGIVAHQFTCPSGLYFNTAADSCDFARNVLCKTKTATTAKTTKAPTTTTSTTTTTTTNSPRITAATSRQTFLRYSSTTTAAPESEEDDYEIDDNDENLKEDEEEDPKVIKELIQLIKKVGGLEELEKQLLQQEDGTMVIKNSKTEQVSTTPSTISKSLYHKVLSKPNNLSSFRRQFEGALSRNAAKSQSASEDAAVEEESEKKSSNKYSSSIRNSRPSPQNAGIEKLAEFEGFLKEKPKYVTITRTRPTAAVSENHFDDDDDEEEVEETSTEEVEDKLRSSKIGRFENSAQLPISTLSYVDIRRSRPQPTTEGYEDDDSVEDDKIISTTSRSSYKSLNRRRLSTIAPTEEPSTTVKSSTINRYKKIERTRPSTISVDDSKGSTISNRDSFTVEDDGPPVTVQFLDVKDYTTHSPTQKSITTRIYESKGILSTRQVATVTETSTISQPTTITSTTSPTTLRESTTNNPTTNNHLLNSPTISEETLSSVDKFPTQITISPVTEPLPSVPTLPVSNTEGNDNTTVITDKTTDESHQNSKDEVTMTDSKVEANGTSSTQSKINLTKHSEVKSSLKGTNINLSKLENTVTVTNTDKLTTLQKIDVDKSTTTTTTQTIDSTSKEFLGTVSSPRPFGFPRRRTRPTIARKPFSTTNQESVNNTFTTPPTQKVSSFKTFNNTSRDNSKYVSRNIVENVSSVSDNMGVGENVQGVNVLSSQGPPKRPKFVPSFSNIESEADNKINSQLKRSYSWRSQINRTYRPWKVTNSSSDDVESEFSSSRSRQQVYRENSNSLNNFEQNDSNSYRTGNNNGDNNTSRRLNVVRQQQRVRRPTSQQEDSQTSNGQQTIPDTQDQEEIVTTNRRVQKVRGQNGYSESDSFRHEIKNDNGFRNRQVNRRQGDEGRRNSQVVRNRNILKSGNNNQESAEVTEITASERLNKHKINDNSDESAVDRYKFTRKPLSFGHIESNIGSDETTVEEKTSTKVNSSDSSESESEVLQIHSGRNGDEDLTLTTIEHDGESYVGKESNETLIDTGKMSGTKYGKNNTENIKHRPMNNQSNEQVVSNNVNVDSLQHPSENSFNMNRENKTTLEIDTISSPDPVRKPYNSLRRGGQPSFRKQLIRKRIHRVETNSSTELVSGNREPDVGEEKNVNLNGRTDQFGNRRPFTRFSYKENTRKINNNSENKTEITDQSNDLQTNLSSDKRRNATNSIRRKTYEKVNDNAQQNNKRRISAQRVNTKLQSQIINETQSNEFFQEKDTKQNQESRQSQDNRQVEFKRPQKNRPTNFKRTTTRQPERNYRPDLGTDLSSLLSGDKWEYLGRTQISGGSFVRRRRPIVKIDADPYQKNNTSIRVENINSTTPEQKYGGGLLRTNVVRRKQNESNESVKNISNQLLQNRNQVIRPIRPESITQATINKIEDITTDNLESTTKTDTNNEILFVEETGRAALPRRSNTVLIKSEEASASTTPTNVIDTTSEPANIIGRKNKEILETSSILESGINKFVTTPTNEATTTDETTLPSILLETTTNSVNEEATTFKADSFSMGLGTTISSDTPTTIKSVSPNTYEEQSLMTTVSALDERVQGDDESDVTIANMGEISLSTTMMPELSTISSNDGETTLPVVTTTTLSTTSPESVPIVFESTQKTNLSQSRIEHAKEISTSRRIESNQRNEISSKDTSIEEEYSGRRRNQYNKDDVNILYHRKKHWERVDEALISQTDSPIIYIGKIQPNTIERRPKLSRSELRKLKQILSHKTEEDHLTNEGEESSQTNVRQNEEKQLRLKPYDDSSKTIPKLKTDNLLLKEGELYSVTTTENSDTNLFGIESQSTLDKESSKLVSTSILTSLLDSTATSFNNSDSFRSKQNMVNAQSELTSTSSWETTTNNEITTTDNNFSEEIKEISTMNPTESLSESTTSFDNRRQFKDMFSTTKPFETTTNFDFKEDYSIRTESPVSETTEVASSPDSTTNTINDTTPLTLENKITANDEDFKTIAINKYSFSSRNSQKSVNIQKSETPSEFTGEQVNRGRGKYALAHENNLGKARPGRVSTSHLNEENSAIADESNVDDIKSRSAESILQRGSVRFQSKGTNPEGKKDDFFGIEESERRNDQVKKDERFISIARTRKIATENVTEKNNEKTTTRNSQILLNGGRSNEQYADNFRGRVNIENSSNKESSTSLDFGNLQKQHFGQYSYEQEQDFVSTERQLEFIDDNVEGNEQTTIRNTLIFLKGPKPFKKDSAEFIRNENRMSSYHTSTISVEDDLEVSTVEPTSTANIENINLLSTTLNPLTLDENEEAFDGTTFQNVEDFESTTRNGEYSAIIRTRYPSTTTEELDPTEGDAVTRKPSSSVNRRRFDDQFTTAIPKRKYALQNRRKYETTETTFLEEGDNTNIDDGYSDRPISNERIFTLSSNNRQFGNRIKLSTKVEELQTDKATETTTRKRIRFGQNQKRVFSTTKNNDAEIDIETTTEPVGTSTLGAPSYFGRRREFFRENRKSFTIQKYNDDINSIKDVANSESSDYETTTKLENKDLENETTEISFTIENVKQINNTTEKTLNIDNERVEDDTLRPITEMTMQPIVDDETTIFEININKEKQTKPTLEADATTPTNSEVQTTTEEFEELTSTASPKDTETNYQTQQVETTELVEPVKEDAIESRTESESTESSLNNVASQNILEAESTTEKPIERLRRPFLPPSSRRQFSNNRSSEILLNRAVKIQNITQNNSAERKTFSNTRNRFAPNKFRIGQQNNNNEEVPEQTDSLNRPRFRPSLFSRNRSTTHATIEHEEVSTEKYTEKQSNDEQIMTGNILNNNSAELSSTEDENREIFETSNTFRNKVKSNQTFSLNEFDDDSNVKTVKKLNSNIQETFSIDSSNISSQNIAERESSLELNNFPNLSSPDSEPGTIVNNFPNVGLTWEDGSTKNVTSVNNITNSTKWLNSNQRFQKISINSKLFGNRSENSNNGDIESTTKIVNGRRVRVLKVRKPTLNSVQSNGDSLGERLSIKAFDRKFIPRRPSINSSALLNGTSEAENVSTSEERNSTTTNRKFKKVLRKIRPVVTNSNRTSSDSLSTKNSFDRITFSNGRTHLLRINKEENVSSDEVGSTEISSIERNLNITQSPENTETEIDTESIDFTSTEMSQETETDTTIRDDNEYNVNNNNTAKSAFRTTTAKNKLFASRRPYRPTKPSISAITSTESTATTVRSYVRKYSNNFNLPKPPLELSTTVVKEEDKGDIFIRPLAFNKNRDVYQNKFNRVKSQKYNREDGVTTDVEEEEEEAYEDLDNEEYDDQDEADKRVDDEKVVPDYKTPNFVASTNRPTQNIWGQNYPNRPLNEFQGGNGNSVLGLLFGPGSTSRTYGSLSRTETKTANVPKLVIRLNEDLDTLSDKSELEASPINSEDTIDDVYYDEESEEKTSEDSLEKPQSEKSDIFSGFFKPPTKNSPASAYPAYNVKRPVLNKPRVVNRPTFTTIHPASQRLGFTTTPLSTTPITFRTNNTRTYERKYSQSSTEGTPLENSHLEDLNIDALNARNKKIFAINSRKHTTVKPKSLQKDTISVKNYTSETGTSLNTTQNEEQNNISTNELLNGFNTLQENDLETEVTPSTGTPRPTPSTTTAKMTTLYHVFALSEEDDSTTESNNFSDDVVNSGKREKLVEINRVVEVYSKEDKLKVNSKGQDSMKIESSQLKLEQNATLERLGEIGRVTLVKLVQSDAPKSAFVDGGELVIEGRSTVADYTPTEPTKSFTNFYPIRNSIPIVDNNDLQDSRKEAKKLQLPEVISDIETSTIPLEGLFESPRRSKDLHETDEPVVYASSLGEVFTAKDMIDRTTMFSTSHNTSPEKTTELPTTTQNPTRVEKSTNYIRPLVPLLRPESNESSPLVISIANLDKVILSKVPRSDSSIASSGRVSTIVEPPKPATLDDAPLVTIDNSQINNTSSNQTVVETQTSFSSEIKVIRRKVPRRAKSLNNHKTIVESSTN